MKEHPADALAKRQNEELIEVYGFDNAAKITMAFVMLSMAGLTASPDSDGAEFMEMMARHFSAIADGIRKASNENS